MRNKKYAEIELKHIQLELENYRFHHFRSFVDQYFCFKNEYVRKSGAADWESIVWNETVSKAAEKIKDRKLVVKEHVVPLRRITKELKILAETKNTSLSHISKCLDQLIFFATITKEEDALLRKNKLHSRMPPEYDEKDHILYRDPFARYKIVGIEYELKP